MHTIDEFIRKNDTENKVKHAIADCLAKNMTKEISLDVLANGLQKRLYDFIDGNEGVDIDDDSNVQRDSVKTIRKILEEYF